MSDNTANSDDLKIAVVGSTGRMGQMLVREVMSRQGCVLSGATDRKGSDYLGRDAGELAGVGPAHVMITDDPAPVIAAADVVIDFTRPEATEEHLRLAAQAGCAFVGGTTGLSEEQKHAIELAARHVPVVFAANMSVGVTLLAALTRKIASVLEDDYDIEIVEMHHRHKVDAPSGTALLLGQSAADGRGVVHEDVKQAVRDGHTGPRPRGEIGYATLRGGDVIGDHTVVFAGEGERIEVTHKASSRHIYATGAVRAAFWTRGRKNGVYDMADVLGLSD